MFRTLCLMSGLLCFATHASAQLPGSVSAVGNPYYYQPAGHAVHGGHSVGMAYAPVAQPYAVAPGYSAMTYGSGFGHHYGYASGSFSGSSAGWPSGAGAYSTHFPHGYYRGGEMGHVRFPYYSYRAPWYFPGPAHFNRDTNYAW